VFSIDNKWRAAWLAELSLRTSHLVLRTFVGTTNINLSVTSNTDNTSIFNFLINKKLFWKTVEHYQQTQPRPSW